MSSWSSEVFWSGSQLSCARARGIEASCVVVISDPCLAGSSPPPLFAALFLSVSLCVSHSLSLSLSLSLFYILSMGQLVFPIPFNPMSGPYNLRHGNNALT